DSNHVELVRIALGVSVGLAFAMGVIGNINFVGLHRYYRDRLMEAFMPSDTAVANGKVSYSAVADELSIAELFIGHTSDEKAVAVPVPVPYPLINTNAIMINDNKPKVATRGGDNFLISPLYVGSTVTGWDRTDDYIRNNGPLTLASAMAASGAAA